jgi:hypothetical protein
VASSVMCRAEAGGWGARAAVVERCGGRLLLKQV